MKTHFRFARLALILLPLAFASRPQAANPDYKPELFKSTRLVYEDTFDGTLNTNFWEVRQSSTWAIKAGVLTGRQSSKEFQAKKLAQGDKAHAGFKPVIWLKQVPENFVCTMRVRYDATNYIPRFPLLDLGHHIHTLTFSEDATTLTIKKNVETVKADQPLFALNQWHHVAIELKKGALIFQVDGQKRVFKSREIDMTGQAQIDFKGIDFGTCQIDDIKVWEGF